MIYEKKFTCIYDVKQNRSLTMIAKRASNVIAVLVPKCVKL